MTPEILSRQAIRLAQRRSQKAGRALTRDEVLRLHIQTVEPWKRVLFVALGLLCGLLPLFCYLKGAPVWIWVPFALGSVALVVLGAFGKKAYLNRELQKLGEEGPTRILDTISNAL